MKRGARGERGDQEWRMAAMRSSGGDEDDYFLSLVDEAEANALLQLSGSGGKRLKGSSPSVGVITTNTNTNKGEVGESEEDGSSLYLAALRGSRSSLWQQMQQQQQKPKQQLNNRYGTGGVVTTRGFSSSDASAAAAGSSPCFKCGVVGHWARDCTSASPAAAGGRGRLGLEAGGTTTTTGDTVSSYGNSGEVPDKECPCGMGVCAVRTSNTTKNPGRQFYRCPLKQENGGCNFFEWCDNNHSSGGVTPSASSLIPQLQCVCGAGPCLVLTTRTGNNIGKQYYRCPGSLGGQQPCGFFKWCNENATVSGDYSTPDTAKPSQSSGGKSGLCGNEGHWSRDCPMSSSNSYAGAGGSQAGSSATCFKCGKVGHWARDCAGQSPTVNAGSRKVFGL